jgi:RNA recognition motif-containing protein
LAFRTTDQDLQAYFEGHGEIKSAVVITRGRRSLGYGFVEFVKREDAEAAVQALDQSTLGDRAVKVEIAKDIVEGQPREPREPRQPRQPRQPKESNQQGQTQGSAEAQTGEPGPAPRRKRQRRNRIRKPASNDADNNNDNSNNSANNNNGGNNNGNNQENNQAGNRRPRQRKERPQREKVLSTTTLFVANLPFTMNDEDLAAIFQGPGFVSARVVRTRNDRSRGYGFAEFANSEYQQQALTEKQGYKVPGPNGTERPLSLSISSSVPETQDESNSNNNINNNESQVQQ